MVPKPRIGPSRHEDEHTYSGKGDQGLDHDAIYTANAKDRKDTAPIMA